MCYLRRKVDKGGGDRVSRAEEKAEFVCLRTWVSWESTEDFEENVMLKEEAGSGCPKLGLS